MVAWIWVAFVLLVLFLLALDLGVFNRKVHVISGGEALGWTVFWIVLALLFNVAVYYLYEHHLLGIGLDIGHELTGRQAALQFLTGYIIEKSLSLDNIFVIAMILAYFRVPDAYQHRLLFWGVLGALVMRGVMIALGTALIHRFDWIVYVFGALLLLTAVRMLVIRHDNVEPERILFVRLARRIYPVSGTFDGPRFFTRLDGRRAATPMFMALLAVESSDVLFAVDSIPAIFAVTRDPFLVFTSNVFAILGLRSLYFFLAAIMARFRYLKMSLVFILAFVGVKMLLAHHHPIPVTVSLAVILGILLVGILASMTGRETDTAPLQSPLAEQPEGLARLTYRKARKLVVLIIGGTILLFGAALLVLPGPGTVVILVGLAVLASEFVWARRLLKRIKESGGEVARTLGSYLGWNGKRTGGGGA